MQVIYADNLQTINEVMYGPKSDELLNGLRMGLSSYDQNILTDLGRRYETTVQQNFEAVSGWAIMNAARKAVSVLSGFDAPDVILPMFSEEAFAVAPPLQMQRYLMADVQLRGLYHKHKVDGWSDTYVDHYPKTIGMDHYDHRLSMSGVVERQEQEDGGVQYSVTEYRHETHPLDKPLSDSNKLDIRRSAMFLRTRHVKGAKDLTSLYDEVIG